MSLALPLVIAVALFVGGFLDGDQARLRAIQDREPARRDFAIKGHKFAFDPPRIEVSQDDLVKIAFTAEDVAHSFIVDAYRIARRARPHQTVVIEFRADQPGRFPFYCNLASDDGCRDMRGELVVTNRPPALASRR